MIRIRIYCTVLYCTQCTVLTECTAFQRVFQQVIACDSDSDNLIKTKAHVIKPHCWTCWYAVQYYNEFAFALKIAFIFLPKYNYLLGNHRAFIITHRILRNHYNKI